VSSLDGDLDAPGQRKGVTRLGDKRLFSHGFHWSQSQATDFADFAIQGLACRTYSVTSSRPFCGQADTFFPRKPLITDTTVTTPCSSIPGSGRYAL
jgi:hypothetical protein